MPDTVIDFRWRFSLLRERESLEIGVLFYLSMFNIFHQRFLYNAYIDLEITIDNKDKYHNDLNAGE